MCHSPDSRPPASPIEGAVASSGGLELTASDGTVFSAYQATPETPNGMNVVILPDVRGLHPYYQALSDRFAEAGFHAINIDYYGRNVGVGVRGDDFDWERYLPEVTPEHVRLDVQAAVERLRSVNPGPVFTVGYCYGGSESWRLSAGGLGLAGVIGFYGQPERVRAQLPDFAVPALLLIAGSDVATEQEDFATFASELEAAGKAHEMHVYDGAPHSFFDRAFGEWEEACADAWVRILDFTRTHGKIAEPESVGGEFVMSGVSGQEAGTSTDEGTGERFERGIAAIESLGSGYEAIFEPVADIAPDLSRYVAEFAFGDLYTRPGLAPRQRQLLTIAALIALGDTEPQLRFHIGGALNVGVEPQAIVETILHCLPYVGFPRTVNAVATAKKVFAEGGLLPLNPT